MHFYMRPIAWTIVRAVRAPSQVGVHRPVDYDDMRRVRSTDSAVFTLAGRERPRPSSSLAPWSARAAA